MPDDASIVLTGCPTPPPVEEGGLEDGSTLSGTLTQDVTLPN